MLLTACGGQPRGEAGTSARAAARTPAAIAEAPSTASVPAALHYEVALDAALSRFEVRLCFEGPAPSELVSGVEGGERALRDPYVQRGEQREPLGLRGRMLVLEGVPADACVSYALDVDALSSFGGMPNALRRGEALLTNSAAWLWRPIAWQRIERASVRFALPQGMRASVPWPAQGDGYRLEPSAFAFSGNAAFGQYEQLEIALTVGTLTVVILEGLSPRTRADVVPWLTTAASTAAQVAGRLPSASTLVALVPSGESSEPVRFGMAMRGGGSSLLLLVSSNAELDALRRDWVAVHELCHLLHPFVAKPDAWLSEGLATYYQEVLRVRAGLLPASEAWRRIYEGSLRGRGAQSGLAQESAEMFENRSFPMVYWAGASFALLADVELRQRSANKRSLDDVIAGLSECCARASQPQPAREVLARMDELAGAPVFSELAARWVHGDALPDLAPLYARLGVQVRDGEVRIAAGADGAAIRDAIMRGGAHGR